MKNIRTSVIDQRENQVVQFVMDVLNKETLTEGGKKADGPMKTQTEALYIDTQRIQTET